MGPIAIAIVSSGGRDWLAFGIAAYGALVASGVAAYQFVRDRPGVKIVLDLGIWPTDDDLLYLWSIRVVNHRTRPITIRSAGLRTVFEGKPADLHPMFMTTEGQYIPSPFPVTLSDGGDLQLYVPSSDLRIVEGAWARDSLDRKFRVRYPSRNPSKRFREWRWKRNAAKAAREREAA